MSIIRSVIIGCGGSLPGRIMSNDELSKFVDTSDEWIRERTGIKERHIASEDETTADIGTEAARQALERAGVDASDIDLIILATSTPDNTFPATAVEIQARLSHHPGCCIRHAGGVLGLRVRAHDGGQFPEMRPV